jgi:hypothetical protein
MPAEAENPKPEEIPLAEFDVRPEADRRHALLRQWTEGFAEDKSVIVVVRTIAENPLGFVLSEVFPELAGDGDELHRLWAACQLASDSVHWTPRLGRHLVCLIPAGGRWFAGLENNVNTLVAGDGYKHPMECLAELRVSLVILVGIYAGRVLEARRNRPRAAAEPGLETEVTGAEPDTGEAGEEKPGETPDPPG